VVGIVVVTRAALLIARRAATWTVDEHLAGLSPACVAVDPRSPAQVYCGTACGGLFRSRDSGRNWEPVGRGIDHRKSMKNTLHRVNSTQTARVAIRSRKRCRSTV
jgi:photosystem II stability/assembly factor-like uncharacterized protein